MATKLGPIDIPLRLDVTQLRADLARLEAGLKRLPSFTQAPSTGETRVPPKKKPEMKKTHEGKDTFLKRLRDETLGRAQGILPQSYTGQTVTQTMLVAKGLLPEQSAGTKILGGAAKVAAAYGIISGAAKLLPESYQLGRAFAGESTVETEKGEGLGRFFEDMFNDVVKRIQKLEVWVTKNVQAVKKSAEFGRAMQRITGREPQLARYFGIFQQYEETQHLFNQRIEQWKAIEAPWITTRTVYEAIKGSANK